MITTITNKLKEIKIKGISFNIVNEEKQIIIKIKCKRKDIIFDDVIIDLELSNMIMHNHNLSIDTYCSDIINQITSMINDDLGLDVNENDTIEQ